MDSSQAAWEEHWTSKTDAVPRTSWLTPFLELLRACDGPILELGCGRGADTAALSIVARRLLAADFSPAAVVATRRLVPLASVLVCDLRQPLPFASRSLAGIVAGLSLHYFSAAAPHAILREISRCLGPHGLFVARVNSTNDVNYGARGYPEIEPHFYSVNGVTKRFFDRIDIHHFFAHYLDIQHLSDGPAGLAPEKWVWTIVARNNVRGR